MKNSSKIVDRIRKALALAENQAGTPEGDTAAKIARQLMQKHAVEVVDLGQDPEDDPMIEHGFEIEKRNQWRRNLAHSLAEHCEVFSLSWGGTNKMTLYGRESGVEVAEYLYSIVVRQVEQHLDDHVAKLKNSGVWGNLSADRQNELHRRSSQGTAPGRGAPVPHHDGADETPVRRRQAMGSLAGRSLALRVVELLRLVQRWSSRREQREPQPRRERWAAPPGLLSG